MMCAHFVTFSTLTVCDPLPMRISFLNISKLLSFLLCVVHSCYIQGQDSGDCRTIQDLTTGTTPELSFCGSAIDYPSVCVPRSFGGESVDPLTLQPIAWGLFPNHTVARKDKWVSDFVSRTIARRKEIESSNGKTSGMRESEWG